MVHVSHYNPAYPVERQRLAIEVLRHGTALHLPDDVALRAEADARQLAAQHEGAKTALARLTTEET